MTVPHASALCVWHAVSVSVRPAASGDASKVEELQSAIAELTEKYKMQVRMGSDAGSSE